MPSFINTLLDIEYETFCCAKKAIKMNIRHQSGRPLSQINYYFLFLYYNLITFISLFMMIISNIIPYTMMYFTSYYLPIWCIVYFSNIITISLIIGSLFIFKQFVKDLMCKCPEP